MRLSSLHLLKLCFVGVKVWPHDLDESISQYAPSFNFDGVEISEGSETRILNKEDDQLIYRVVLRISIKNNGGKIAPYDVDSCVYGDFHISNAVPEEQREDFVTVNGCSMLYGAIREQVMTISARSIHGMLILPTVNFIDKIKEEANITPGKKPRTKKTKIQ